MLHVYTMDQVHAFSGAAHRSVAFDLIEAATAFRMASTPNDKAWKRYVQHLEGRTKRSGREKEKGPQVMSREQAAALKRMSSRRMN